MITTLHIKNIGIIDDLTINFNEGFNVLTGETGAGKSLIIDSLIILCGGRFSKEMIRNGEEYSFVEACIYNPKSQYAEDGNIIISREINLNGKNFCKVNNRLVTVSTLKNIMNDLIDIHAQNDNHSIMSQINHIKYLDGFANCKISELKNEYNILFFKYKEIKKELDENFGNEKEKQRTLDLLTYQLNEINNAKLKIGEEEELCTKLKLVQNSEKIHSNLTKSYTYLNDSVISNLESTQRCLSKIEDFDEKYKEKLNMIKNIYYELQDISTDLNCYIHEEDYNEYDFEGITRRLDLIYNLKRKYGNDIAEILEYKEELQKQINQIENLEENNNRLKIELEKIKLSMELVCDKMHNIRVEFAQSLSEKINIELHDLEMKNASFKVNIERVEYFNENGLDKVEFIISTNLGEEYKPLVKIASGGEISRIMFAIKVILAGSFSSVMIFDEIDIGISGTAAKKVSEKMKNISSNHQIICITHLPVIAAKADYNYLIKKDVINNRTITNVKLLNEMEALKEIARISSGEVTDVTLKHALELKKINKISA